MEQEQHKDGHGWTQMDMDRTRMVMDGHRWTWIGQGWTYMDMDRTWIGHGQDMDKA